MNSELEAIRDAWDKQTGAGREEERTRELCDAYVEAYPEQFTQLQDLTLEQCVESVSVFRNAGFEEDQWCVEVWLLHHFAPQNIGGVAEPVVRIPGVNA